MSITLRNERVLLYALEPSDLSAGFPTLSYAHVDSGDADGAWWGRTMPLKAFSLASALRQEEKQRVTVHFADEVPVTSQCLIRDPKDGQLYRVTGVIPLTMRSEIQVEAETTDGAQYTITSDVPAYTVAGVTVSPASATVAVGNTQAFTATVLSATGTTLTGLVPTWTSSAPATLLMAATGIGEGLQAGSATVTATVDGVAGTADVVVEAA